MGPRLDMVTLLLLAANLIFSFLAFRDPNLKGRFLLHVGAILKGKEYHRVVTSAFLHGDYRHLLFNMLTLYFIGPGT